jgi:hypothetical protein
MIRETAGAPSPALYSPVRSLPAQGKELPCDGDSFEKQQSMEHTSLCKKVFGAIGAASGAVLGRGATIIGAGIAGGMTAAAILGGPVTIGIGAVACMALGLKLEKKTKIGRILGGLIGGATGLAVGMAASKLSHFTPSRPLAAEAKDFSFRTLLNKLKDPLYSSHKKLSHEEAVKLMEGVRPGDLIITSQDNKFNFPLTQKAMGKTGDWTHIGLVSEKNSVLEVLISADGTAETPLEDRIRANQHVMILRPGYEKPEEVKNVIDEARSLFGTMTYDHQFNMKSDDKMYCQEYIYKVFQRGAPDIEVKPFTLLGRELISADEFIASPDIKVVKNTGSSFWLNFLSKFD